MRKKELAIFLSGLRGFAVRKESLEQRESESEIIADVLWKAYMLGDIEGKILKVRLLLILDAAQA